jgi:DNA-binding response OmpR family regulator
MTDKAAKILILEDSRTLAKLLADTLKSKGYEVLVCADGREGLVNFVGFQPDCVLTDLEMPVMNGLEFCRELKASNYGKNTPVIMLTSKDDPRDILAGIAAGADDYLSKKIAMEVVEVKIQAMLRLNDLRKDSVRLERLSTLKELIVTYNHQFNNPLAILMGYTDLVARDPKIMSSIVVKLSQAANATAMTEVASEIYIDNTKMLKIS